MSKLIDPKSMFSVPAAPKQRRYRATWPCGSTWEFDRKDAAEGVPVFNAGRQSGTEVSGTIREVSASLRAYGAKVELVS